MVNTRELTDSEVDYVKWVLREAASLDPDQPLPSWEVLLEHPDLSRYHHGWGRPGDLGVVAEVEGVVVGTAFCRLFTVGNHGHGYVDDNTPEVAVAVAEGHRGGGIGRTLMVELANAARCSGRTHLSLSVDPDNPAMRLYESLGYQELMRDTQGVRMLLEL